MPDSNNAYAIVIADLERKRSEIDAMIIHLKSMAGGDVASSDDAPDHSPQSVVEKNAGAKNPFLGMKVAEAAKVVLQENRAPMSPADITTALEKGGWGGIAKRKTDLGAATVWSGFPYSGSPSTNVGGAYHDSR